MTHKHVADTGQRLVRWARVAFWGSAVWLGLGAGAWAQTIDSSQRNWVQLSASAQRQVPQDWVSVTLTARQEAPDPQTVQAQLRLALDQAMSRVRSSLQTGAVEMRNGAFSVYPRHNREGKVTGWQGHAEWILEGRDTVRIGTLASQVGFMAIQNIAFSLSRDTARRLEAEVQAEAVAHFRAKAAALAQAFGFSTYQLREVTVGSVDVPQETPRPRALAMEAKAVAMDGPMALEPGKAEVQISVTGSVQLQ